MEQEFYPFTFEDVSKLDHVVGEDEMRKLIVEGASDTPLTFFRPMAVLLLQDVNKLQALETSLEDHLFVKSTTKRLLEKFFELVKLWLEENNGAGNFAKLIEAFRSTGRLDFCKTLEKLILDYSLSNTSGDNTEDNYSLSKDFLIVEERPSSSCVKQDSALSNAVILDEIFKKLDFKDKKNFRLVTSSWKQKTLSLWRRNAKINVTGAILNPLVDILEEEMAKNRAAETGGGLQQEVAGGSLNYNHELIKYPFRAYKISYYGGRGTAISLFGSEDARFWELLSPQIEHLQFGHTMILENDPRTLYSFCNTILVNKCHNLKTLKIANDYYKGYAGRFTENHEDVKVWWAKRNAFWQRHCKNRMAKKLHTLRMEIPTDTKTIWNILYLCPSLKVLAYKTRNGLGLEALLYPTANGEIIKLEELRQRFTYGHHIIQQDYLPLRKYVEMLNKNNLSCLRKLYLLGIHLVDARAAPFHFISALAKCSASLTTLEMEMYTPKTQRDEPMDEDFWFIDISPLTFPNLTVFKFCSDNQSDYYGGEKGHQILFDFGTLKGMPKLEKLEIRMKLDKDHQRRPGTQNWIFEGDRNKFIPQGVTSDYSFEEPISCPNLREFTFSGWALNEEDITLLSNWFPRLIFLDAEVKPEHLPFLLHKWERLEGINIQTEQLITLRQLRPIKEKKRRLRITQLITGEDSNRSIELKEHKGRIYFNY